MRDTEYATELARAVLVIGGDEARMERLLVKATGTEEIRFSWWRDGRMLTRPLDLAEADLIALFREGIQSRVFSDRFVLELVRVLIAHPSHFRAEE